MSFDFFLKEAAFVVSPFISLHWEPEEAVEENASAGRSWGSRQSPKHRLKQNRAQFCLMVGLGVRVQRSSSDSDVPRLILFSSPVQSMQRKRLMGKQPEC